MHAVCARYTHIHTLTHTYTHTHTHIHTLTHTYTHSHTHTHTHTHLPLQVEHYNNVTRTNGDFNVSAYDLAATYMPAWKATVQGGGALGIMCSCVWWWWR